MVKAIFDNFPILESERLRLRQMTAADVAGGFRHAISSDQKWLCEDAVEYQINKAS